MNGEIKFRYTGKNLSDKLFIKIFTIQDIEENEVFKWMKKNNIVPSTVKRDQYTGYKDSEKQEIYEGNIVKLKGGKTLYKIVFMNGSFYIANLNEKKDYFLLYMWYSDCKVIGNIHTNLELLEVKI